MVLLEAEHFAFDSLENGDNSLLTASISTRDSTLRLLITGSIALKDLTQMKTENHKRVLLIQGHRIKGTYYFVGH